MPLVGLATELWLGDERDVEETSSERNAALVERAFADCAWVPVPILRRWPAGGAEAASAAYALGLAALGQPFFDLSFLGIGEDGHTAGLFPGEPALLETRRLALASRAPLPPRARMTLSPPALASTRRLRFLLRGQAKRDLVLRLSGAAAAPAADPAAGRPSGGGGSPAELVASLAEARGADVAISWCET